MNFERSTIDTQDEAIHNPLEPEPSPTPVEGEPHQGATRSIVQSWGLHPGNALLLLVIDTMLFGMEVGGLGGAVIPIACAVAAVLGFITYWTQMRWYGDDSQNATIKAVIVGLLTAIPTPLPAFLYVPAGLVGLMHTLRRK